MDKNYKEGDVFLFSGNSEGLFDYENVKGVLKLNSDNEFYVHFENMSNEMLSFFSESQITPC